MEPNEHQNPFVRKLSVMECIDVLMQFVAFILGLSFLLGFFKAANSGSELGQYILMVSHMVLMFFCIAFPMRNSRGMRATFLVVAVIAVVDFVVRVSPEIHREHYFTDIAFYATEFIAGIWFTTTRFSKPTRAE